MTTVYDFSAVDIDGQPRALAEFRGKLLLIVNVVRPADCGVMRNILMPVASIAAKCSGGTATNSRRL